MDYKRKLQLAKIGVIVVSWVIIGFVISVYDYVLISTNLTNGPSETYAFINAMGFNMSAGLIGSVLGGAFLVFILEEKFRTKSYGFTVLAVLVSFILITAFITVVLGLVFVPIATGKPLSHPETQEFYREYLTNPLHAKNVIVWGVVVAFSQLFLQINNKFGHGILLNFIKGKYRNPQSESRIFMFLDLKSSTSIAERLGNKKYHSFLKDFFNDITNPILYNRGEIYQYVGDEVVISWQLEHGVENNYCLRCYFDLLEHMEALGPAYMEKYGVAPEFKAGIHCGMVVAGEIGVIKRDITYSGDVLNTTARIQGKCNELNSPLLASDDLIGALKPLQEFVVRQLGSIPLRGKEKDIQLSTIDIRS